MDRVLPSDVDEEAGVAALDSLTEVVERVAEVARRYDVNVTLRVTPRTHDDGDGNEEVE